MALQPGSRVGSYVIKSALGTGGMGEVYCARDTKLNRDVAIKVLRELFAADPDRLGRFEREAQLLASLNHPHIAVRARQLVVRSWRDNNGRFEIGPEHVVAPLAFGSGWTYGAPYDVAPNGRFLALVRTEPSPPPRIRVVLGWDREVIRLGSQGRQ